MSGFLSGKKSKIQKAQTNASFNVLKLADEFAALKPIGMMPSTQRAIDLANSNVGNYQPYVDRATELTNESAKGITPEQITGYMNPYIDSVLNFSVKDMEDAAARRREEMRAIASRSGNDFASSGGSLNRFQVESDLADRGLFRDVGALSASTRAGAFDAATRLATDERNRQASAGGAFSNLGTNVSSMAAGDVGRLAGAGELEAGPQEDERKLLSDKINIYNSAIQGVQPSVENNKKPSMLSQIAGLAGAAVSVAGAPFTGGASLAGLPSSLNMAGGGGGMGTGGLSNASSSQMRPSDRRLKRNIVRIGTHLLGIGWYEWDYVWGERSRGVMADELRKVMPAAVSTVGGFDVVDYSMIGD